MTKKAQFEIMGLAFIVLILVVGMLVFFMLSQNQKHETIVKTYSNTEFAQNYIEVFLRTTTICPNVGSTLQISVEELLKDCAGDQRLKCDSDQPDSCQKVEKMAKEKLDGTLKVYNQQYSFEVKKTGSSPSDLFKVQSSDYQKAGFKCNEKERPGRQPIPPNILVTLEICG